MDTTDAATVEMMPKNNETEFFSVTLKKLIFLSIVTFGLYDLYWQYKNWKVIKSIEATDISPFWRAFFAYFFIHSLFKKMYEKAEKVGLKDVNDTDTFAGLWIICVLCGTISGRLDSVPNFYLVSVALFFVSYLSVISLIRMQRVSDYYNTQINPTYKASGKFNISAILIAIVGTVLTLFVIIGFFLPA
jgi:hypothetical protein